MKFVQAADLSLMNTFGLASKCNEMVVVEDLSQLPQAIESCQHPIRIIGECSNVILPASLEASVMRISSNKISIKTNANDYLVTVDAGCNWDTLLRQLIDNGIAGAENLAAIPGSIGAAPIQNIGAYGVEIGSFVYAVEGYDLVDSCYVKLSNQECQFGYRDSVFKRELKDRFIISKVHFRFSKQWQPNLTYSGLQEQTGNTSLVKPLDIYNLVTKIRWSKLPKPEEMGNTGSFFKNPVIDIESFNKIAASYYQVPNYKIDEHTVKVPAAWLIEKSGLKGKVIDKVGTYIKQPLVLVNHGGATYQNVLTMVGHIQRKVAEQFDIQLEPEVQIW